MCWLLSTGHRKRPVVRQAMKGAELLNFRVCVTISDIGAKLPSRVTCDVVFGFGLKHWKAYNNKSE